MQQINANEVPLIVAQWCGVERVGPSAVKCTHLLLIHTRARMTLYKCMFTQLN